jgi:hypothetical protein
MPHLIRTAIMIVAAMIGSAIVLAGLILVVGNLTTYGHTPADFLPEDRTVALFHDVDAHTVQKWSAHFPSLAEAVYETGSIIGIIQNEDNTYSAAIFTRSTAGTLGQYAVSFAEQPIEPLVGKQKSPLSRNATYKMLETVHMHMPWIYIATTALPQPDGIRSTLEFAALYGNSDAVGIQESGNHFVVSSQGSANYISIQEQVAELGNTIFRVSIAEPQVLWKELHKTLPTQSATIIDGILRQYLSAWGLGISLEHDILVLLKDPSTVHITQSGSINHILLEGSMKDIPSRGRIIDRIHESFISTLPATTITKRVLDKRFTAVDIRHDEGQIQNSQTRTGNWVVRETTSQINGASIASATSGTEFLLSDNLDTLQEAIESKGRLHTPSSTELIRSQGMIKLSEIDVLLSSILQSKDRKTLREDFANTLEWDTIINGSIIQKDLFF